MRTTNHVVRKRLFIALLLGLLLFGALLARLGYVQLVRGPWLQEKAEELWTRDIPFEGNRGRILDRNGKVMAYNISAPSVLAIPAQIKDPKVTARALAQILLAPEDKIFQLITKRELIVRINPYGRKLSEERAKAVHDLRLPGIAIAEDNKRYYPMGTMAAHILGFAGIDNQGLAGLELVYDKRLQGKRGHVSYSANAKGERLPGSADQYTPPTDGLDLELTLDKSIQAYIEREMDQAMAQYQAENIMVIAMNPKTGEILGMGSRPTFHPSDFRKVDPLIYNRNLPIWRTYEPGSTFKIITLAAALEEKKVNLGSYFYDPGYIKVAGARLRCWKHGGHGSETFLEVVENSCNPGFVTMGQRLGEEKLFSYIRKFGFGEKTGIDLNGEAKGILFTPEQAGPVELATTSFGQGVSVTPIQQVSAVAAAVNGGKLMQPHLEKAWINPDTNKVVEEIRPQLKRRVISESTSEQVRTALESVVARGTGRKAFIDGYRVGGKTGTAQKVGPDGRYMKNNHIVSFIGFAPADDPQLVVYVAVDNPKGVQFGGVVAAPIVKEILGDSLRHLKVPKRKKQISPENSPLEAPIITIPNLVGSDLDELRTSLEDIELQVRGKGNKVISQTPKPGQRVKKGTPIRIYLGDQ
ncbi:stage V sporulation protein D [Marininema halotolerans]|uniref:Stage V sporulation protein D (Sporulation-specific penicillin-binding protein) n=1 Tax=Marininema halotolerans TaxID=1155944 RepID=A0A1I6QBT6_9BACL|nr:stage V sporulation protein D [Marininema halotolerans]SFS49931.1 stage V sporulation protein D (sporulation-specific penicillin-binding protein) [Marininema halotolerans]